MDSRIADEARELTSSLRRLGVRLRVEDGSLRMEARRGVVGPELLARVAERKDAIIRVLSVDVDRVRASGGPAAPIHLEDVRVAGALRGVRMEFGADVASAVQRVCAESGLTPSMFYLAAQALALRDVGGRPESVVAFPVDARAEAGPSSTAAPRADLVLIRVAPDGEQSIREYLGQIRSQVTSAARRDIHDDPVVDGFFEYVCADERPAAGLLKARPHPGRGNAVTLSVVDEPGRIGLEVERGSEEAGEDLCRKLAEKIGTLIPEMLGDRERSLATLTSGAAAPVGLGGSPDGSGGSGSTTPSGEADRGTGRDAHGLFGVVLPLRPAGTEPPLFCVHPALGLSWCYVMLLGHLAQEHPVYGLQTASLRSPGYLASSVEEIADGYLREIRGIQPHGPYHLLSWSFGGLVAHRLAVLLQRSGEEVALLSVMDAAPLPELGEVGEEELVREALSTLLGSDDAAELAMAELPADATAEDLKRQLKAHNPTFPELDLATIERLMASTVNHFRLLLGHVPGVFDGELTFFAGTSRHPSRIASDPRRWDGHVRGVDRVQLDCDHLDMAGPEAMARIGAHLNSRMKSWNSERAEKGAASKDT
ncbi:thioesterase domain-containing protein [Nonomuraea sp. NPDC050643]|uniref:thioesterase domain-containing protein n=1 Tax=Nonomuraea sp. NPDC050643 TaxID=3155660 RepID=UPI00340ADA13